MNKRFLFVIILYSIFSLIFLKTAWSAELVAGESAQIISASSSSTISKPSFDLRKIKLQKFLEERKSVLQNHTETIMQASKEYNVDYRLFSAIAGVESGYCQAYIVSTNNCVGWGGGYIRFKTIDDQIITVVKNLREKYLNDGLTSVDQIGSRYAADPEWSFKVKKNIKEIEETSIL